MKPFKPKQRIGPEALIQDALIKFLQYKGWYIKSTHGNMYQQGFPDLYATHSKYGPRWIEVKNPNSYTFTAAQLEDFQKLEAHGSRIWILVAATEEEYAKLFGPSNWWQYLHR